MIYFVSIYEIDIAEKKYRFIDNLKRQFHDIRDAKRYASNCTLKSNSLIRGFFINEIQEEQHEKIHKG